MSVIETGCIAYEISKYDSSISGHYTIHNLLCVAAVDQLCTDSQRKRILPEVVNMDKLMSFGLTEPDHGSDATGMETYAEKVDGGFLISGRKRWIGKAAVADYIIVWAKNKSDKNKIQGFLVAKGSAGLRTKKIENKYAARMIDNADIWLDRVFVSDENRLEKADDFQKGTNIILE